MENVIFWHPRVGLGRATLAIDLEENAVAVAWCSPRDNFSRARGREIALGRLRAGRHTQVLPDNVESATLPQIRRHSLEAALPTAPCWASRQTESERLFALHQRSVRKMMDVTSYTAPEAREWKVAALLADLIEEVR